MSDELSTIKRRKPHTGISHWVECKYSHSDINPVTGNGTDHIAVPDLMPGTIIFVHGVNSEGEWYEDASKQFAEGLNQRLGRDDITQLVPFEKGKGNKHRFKRHNSDGTLYRCPIIPFYWGYKLQDGDLDKYPGLYHDRTDMAWGGGPFQNGTNNLLKFWQDGFKRKIFKLTPFGWGDLDIMNSELGRQLEDAPPRSYYLHAARRLANLIDQIREDCPNEPLNLVAHSQGNMIVLCAMLFLKEQTRAPDTLLLNNAPYSFAEKLTDNLTDDTGFPDKQGSEARVKTFANIAEKIANATKNFPLRVKTADQCMRYAPKNVTTVHMQYDPNDSEEKCNISIGCGKNAKGKRWYEDPLHTRENFNHNRGKIFVNFNPNDRVIGVSAVEGIGWGGISAKYLNEKGCVFPNVVQRLFVRNSLGIKGAPYPLPNTTASFDFLPKVGETCGYEVNYFKTTTVRQDVMSGNDGNAPTAVVASDGTKWQSEFEDVRTFDGKLLNSFWIFPPKMVTNLPIAIQGTPDWNTRVWINAPVVPNPCALGEDFVSEMIPFNGVGVNDNGEQMEDYRIYKDFYVPTPPETKEQAHQRIDATLGHVLVAPTDHSRFLRYGKDTLDTGKPVAQVLTYDLCVGPGYAFGDHEYWAYLLNLADWKVSDPCYVDKKPYPAAGPYPKGLATDKDMGR